MAKIYGSAEVAGRCLAEYEHRSACLRGPDEALPRQDQTDSTAAAAPTVWRERRDRRKKKLAKEEAERVETREAQAAQATTRAANHVLHNDEDEAAEAVNTASAVPIEEAEQRTESVMDTEGDDRAAARQEGGTGCCPQ